MALLIRGVTMNLTKIATRYAYVISCYIKFLPIHHNLEDETKSTPSRDIISNVPPGVLQKGILNSIFLEPYLADPYNDLAFYLLCTAG